MANLGTELASGGSITCKNLKHSAVQRKWPLLACSVKSSRRAI